MLTVLSWPIFLIVPIIMLVVYIAAVNDGTEIKLSKLDIGLMILWFLSGFYLFGIF